MCFRGHSLLTLYASYCYFSICVINIVDDMGNFLTHDHVEKFNIWCEEFLNKIFLEILIAYMEICNLKNCFQEFFFNVMNANIPNKYEKLELY